MRGVFLRTTSRWPLVGEGVNLVVITRVGWGGVRVEAGDVVVGFSSLESGGGGFCLRNSDCSSIIFVGRGIAVHKLIMKNNNQAYKLKYDIIR